MQESRRGNNSKDVVILPEPAYDGPISIESALRMRRSVRDYTSKPVTLAEISQLLWAAQGVTGQGGERTAPSAGALYPLETYVVAGTVDGLTEGVYKYQPHRHTLMKIGDGDKRAALARASLGQECIRSCAAAIVFAAVFDRTTREYGKRGIRYVHMDVAHAGQNVHLQVVSLGLGTVVVGAFDDERVKKIVQLGRHEEPLYIMPLGRIK